MSSIQTAREEAAAQALNPLAWAEYDRSVSLTGEPSPELIVEHSLNLARAAIAAIDEVEVQTTRSSARYISPNLPSMIRGLYRADLLEASIQTMLDLAADLVQELIDVRAKPAPTVEQLANAIAAHRFQEQGLTGEPTNQDVSTAMPLARVIHSSLAGEVLTGES